MACRGGSCSRNTNMNQTPTSSVRGNGIIPTDPNVQNIAPQIQNNYQPTAPMKQNSNFNPSGNFSRTPIYNPQQMQALSQILGAGQNMLKNPMADISGQEALTRRNFNEQTIPSIADRFLGGNTRNSSGFETALGRSAVDLETTLQALREQFGQQKFGNALQLLQMGLTPQESIMYHPQEPGFWDKLQDAMFRFGPSALATILGGPAAGAAIGTAMAGSGSNQISPGWMSALHNASISSGLAAAQPNQLYNLVDTLSSGLAAAQPNQLYNLVDTLSSGLAAAQPNQLYNLVDTLGTQDSVKKQRRLGIPTTNRLFAKQLGYQS